MDGIGGRGLEDVEEEYVDRVCSCGFCAFRRAFSRASVRLVRGTREPESPLIDGKEGGRDKSRRASFGERSVDLDSGDWPGVRVLGGWSDLAGRNPEKSDATLPPTVVVETVSFDSIGLLIFGVAPSSSSSRSVINL